MRVLRRWLHDTGRAWENHGARGLLAEARESFILSWFRHGRVIVVETPLDEIPPFVPPDGLRFEAYRSEDWSPFSAIVPERVVGTLRRRAARAGRTCITALRGDRVVGYTWVSERISHRVERHPIPLPADAAYGWNLFVVPTERGTGVGSALLAARHWNARDRGFRVMWRAIDPENRASRRTVQKAWTPGSRIVGELRYVNLLGWAAGRINVDAAPRFPGQGSSQSRV